MQYSIVGNDIALIMHYCALLKGSEPNHCPGIISVEFYVIISKNLAIHYDIGN